MHHHTEMTYTNENSLKQDSKQLVQLVQSMCPIVQSKLANRKPCVSGYTAPGLASLSPL